MNGIVSSVDGKVTTTSLILAEKFGKPHRDVTRAIRNTIQDLPGDFAVRNFAQSDFTNDRGRTYTQYTLTRDAFSLIAMGFTGPRALRWKIKFIQAFNAMERELLKKQDALEWKQARQQSKEVRKSVTDSIAAFVEYAKAQGSTNAEKYYPNVTKMEYKALELIAKNEKVSENFRDSLDQMQLSFLIGAEQVAKAAMEQGMHKGLHYKDIYQDAKTKVLAYSESVSFARLGNRAG